MLQHAVSPIPNRPSAVPVFPPAMRVQRRYGREHENLLSAYHSRQWDDVAVRSPLLRQR